MTMHPHPLPPQASPTHNTLVVKTKKTKLECCLFDMGGTFFLHCTGQGLGGRNSFYNK